MAEVSAGSSWNKENETGVVSKKAAAAVMRMTPRSVSPTAAMRYARVQGEETSNTTNTTSISNNNSSSAQSIVNAGDRNTFSRRAHFRMLQQQHPPPVSLGKKQRRASLVSRSLQNLPKTATGAPPTSTPYRTPLATPTRVSIGVAQSHSKLSNFPMIQSRDMAIRETGFAASAENDENANLVHHHHRQGAPHSTLRGYPMIQSRDEAIRRSIDDGGLRLSSSFSNAKNRGGGAMLRASCDTWSNARAGAPYLRLGAHEGDDDDEQGEEEESEQIRRKLDTVIMSSQDAHGELDRWRREFAGLQRLWLALQGGGEQRRLPNIKPSHVAEIVRGIRTLTTTLQASKEEAEHEMKSLLDKCVELGDQRSQLEAALREQQEEGECKVARERELRCRERTEFEETAERQRKMLVEALSNPGGGRAVRARGSQQRPKSWPRDASSSSSHSSDDGRRNSGVDDTDVRRWLEVLGENLSPGTMEVAAGLMQGEAAMERDVFERALEREELIDDLQGEVRSLKESLAIAHVELRRTESGRRTSSSSTGAPSGAADALSIADGHLSKAGQEMEQLRNDLASTRNAIRQSKSMVMVASTAAAVTTRRAGAAAPLAAAAAAIAEEDGEEEPTVSPVRFTLGGENGSSIASPRAHSESRGKTLLTKLEEVQRNLDEEKDRNRALSERLLASHRKLEDASLELEKQEGIERDLRDAGFRLLQAVGGSGGASSHNSATGDFSSPPAPVPRSAWNVRPGRWEPAQMQYTTHGNDAFADIV